MTRISHNKINTTTQIYSDTLLSNTIQINNSTNKADDTGSSGFTFQYQIISILSILLVFYVLAAIMNLYLNYKDKKDNEKKSSELNKMITKEVKNYKTHYNNMSCTI